MDRMQLLEGDCLDLLSNVDDKSIDMICSDLPYEKRQCPSELSHHLSFLIRLCHKTTLTHNKAKVVLNQQVSVGKM